MKLSSGHAIALWKKRCGIDQKKVDHLAFKNLCVLQGSGIIKMIRNWPSLGKVTNSVHRKMYVGLHEHVA